MVEPIRAFVCGHPVAHSRSPLIHGHWLKQHGINGSYERIDVAPGDIEAFLAKLPESDFAGGNVTIPHKEAAFAAVSMRDAAAEAIGAVNTLWLDDGRLHGGNTDALGFASNLDDFAREWRSGRVAVVIGAGGASRAVVYALLTAGFTDIRVVNRTKGRAAEIAERFGAKVSAHGSAQMADLLVDADLLVNTTSLGMDGNAEIPADVGRLPDSAVVTDIVYVPLKTPLLVSAEARGLKTVDGLGMLLHQAAPGFARWFGLLPEVTPELRALVIADMEQHA